MEFDIHLVLPDAFSVKLRYTHEPDLQKELQSTSKAHIYISLITKQIQHRAQMEKKMDYPAGLCFTMSLVHGRKQLGDTTRGHIAGNARQPRAPNLCCVLCSLQLRSQACTEQQDESLETSLWRKVNRTTALGHDRKFSPTDRDDSARPLCAKT